MQISKNNKIIIEKPSDANINMFIISINIILYTSLYFFFLKYLSSTTILSIYKLQTKVTGIATIVNERTTLYEIISFKIIFYIKI